MISKKDILILISNSGETDELKNIIQFANRNKILLIGIVSRKNSVLYKASDIKAGGIVPTSSTTAQLALGDAIAITSMQMKKFGKLDFKKLHPSGSLSNQLKTVEDLMLVKNKVPFVNENLTLEKGIKIINNKKLGVVITRNNKNITTGIVTDGDIKRIIQKHSNIKEIKLKKIIKNKPLSVDKNLLAAKALKIMNENKITSLCVHSKVNKNKTIGLLHIHNILEANIN